MSETKKIAIVCGHFIENLGYLEVYLAKKLAEKGCHLKVITSTKIPTYVKSVAQLQTSSTLPVTRLNPYFSLGQMVLAKGIIKEIENFSPDLIITIGVGKLFPKPVYHLSKKYPIITLFGDNSDNYNLKSGGVKVKLKRFFQFNLLKKPVYKKAILSSQKLVGYTPETKDILINYFPDLSTNIAKKYQFVSLGFDENDYFYSETIRNNKRQALKVDADTKIGITVTRLKPNKEIEKIILFVKLLSQKIPIRYFIIGSENDDYSNKLQQLITKYQLENYITILPFENDKKQLNAWYNAADFGIWTQPAISFVEAMGTGLPLILPNKESMTHLLNKFNGLYFNSLNNDFTDKTVLFLQTIESREKLAEKNSAISYSKLVDKIIAL